METERLFTKFSMLIVIALLLQMEGLKACLEPERTALLEIKSFFFNSSNDTQENELQSWVDDKDSDCCNWSRVECNTNTGRVMNLSLSNVFYDGGILNFSLFQPFKDLRSLDLSVNFLEGWAASKARYNFRSLKQLKVLNLGSNFFNSSILPHLSTITSLTALVLPNNNIKDFNPRKAAGLTNLRNLINLEFLDLSANKLNGSTQELGAELGNLKKLVFLDLSLNDITGTLQELGICKLENLVELDLTGNNLEGHISTCLNNLTNLRILKLASNKITGNIPSAIGGLTSLEYLFLENNNFEGQFLFSSLANLSKLEEIHLSTYNSTLQVLETENFSRPPSYQLKYLYISKCNLHAIPSSLKNQHKLEFIDLSDNKLVGMFPTWLLHNNTRLQAMYLMNNSLTGILQLPNSKHDLLDLRISNNNLNGQLPKNLGMILPKMTTLYLSKNSFEGHIPSSMGEMKELLLLDLSSNNFSGELPRSFVSGCYSLGFLRLSYNNFHGEIFLESMNMTQLQWLQLDNNKFGGKIQDGLSKANFLNLLDISNNLFLGQIPHWIGNFSSLEILILSNNLLEGGVPVELTNMEGLKDLDISENKLSGSLTSSFNFSSMEYLHMQKNAFSGSIPNAIFKSSKLLVLDLRENKLVGRIPNQIDDEFLDLRVLLLGGNYLEGRIPQELCRLKNVSILDLSSNKLNGTIPSCFTGMLSWVNDRLEIGFSLDVTRRTYSIFYDIQGYGTLTVEFVTKNRDESFEGSILQYMVGLDFSSNELTGDIPSELGYLRNIHAVNLSHNSLSGFIPESFSNLKNVESLDLSYNKLSGKVPPQLTELYRLAIFNVSFNNLSGPTPNNGQFATFDESNYRGNAGLCGSQVKRSCSSEPTTPSSVGEEEEEDESAIDIVSFYWSLCASYVTTILMLVFILYLNPYWRRQWFWFVDECIVSCHCWILRNIFHRQI